MLFRICLLACALAAGCSLTSTEETVPCDSLTGEAANLCLVAQIEDVVETDPRQAITLAGKMDRGLTRDAAVLLIARSSYLRVCDQIDDPSVMKACRSTMNRPHLQQKGPSNDEVLQHGQTPAVSAILKECRSVGDPDQRAQCLDNQAPTLETFPEQMQVCNEIRSIAERMGCIFTLGEQLSTAESVAANQLQCDALTYAEAQSECRFKLAEAMWTRPVSERITMCIAAQNHTRSCIGHVLNRLSLETVHTSAGGSFREFVQALNEVENALQLSTSQAEPPIVIISSQLWYQAFRHLLSEVQPASALVRWIPMGATFAKDDWRGRIWIAAVAGEWAKRRWLPAYQADPVENPPSLQAMQAMFTQDFKAVSGVVADVNQRPLLPSGKALGDLEALHGGQRFLPFLVDMSPEDPIPSPDDPVVELMDIRLHREALEAALVWGVIAKPTQADLIKTLLKDAWRQEGVRLRLTALESSLLWVALFRSERWSDSIGRSNSMWVKAEASRFASTDANDAIRRCAAFIAETIEGGRKFRVSARNDACRKAD